MSAQVRYSFEDYLKQQGGDDGSWGGMVASLLPFIHDVDKTATQIWFAFHPLALLCALEEAEDRENLAKQLLLQGKYYLKDQIDSSHTFLYGHRYWPEVKRAVAEHAEFDSAPANVDLASQIREVARAVAARTKVEESLLVGITAVAFMTLRQVGLEAFKKSPGAVNIDRKHVNKSPDQILKARARDNRQGPLGFLKTVDQTWTVTFDENRDDAKYKMRHLQDLAWGAAEDKRDWRAIDPRRKEGPIPVECRSASCGTCWVGVLGGAEKLSDVAALEAKKIKEFGYIDTDEPKPLIRLACQAQTSGAVSIVIPPWNGVYGKYLAQKGERQK